MIETLKEASIIKFHESGIGYAVVEHRLIPLNFEELEVEDVKYIFENGEQVSRTFEIRCQTRGELFEYSIHNGMEYELADVDNIYSKYFFTQEEFKEMCEEAYKELKEEEKYPDIWRIAQRIKEKNPGVFVSLNLGTGWAIP